MTYDEFEMLRRSYTKYASRRGNGMTYALEALEKGDSVLLPETLRQSAAQAATRIGRTKGRYLKVCIQRCIIDGHIEGVLVTRVS